MKRKYKGFTIAELLVSLVILATLMCILVPAFEGYTAFAGKKRAESAGENLYMAAYAAVDTVYSLHNTEYCNGLKKASSGGEEFYYGYLTGAELSRVQYDADGGKDFDFAAGFKRMASRPGNENKRNAYLARFVLEGLGALNKNPALIDERLRFTAPVSPAGSGLPLTVDGYIANVEKVTYSAGGEQQNCRQAGVVVCYGKTDSGGTVFFTEYGDEDGYLVICVNPAWYSLVKDRIKDVGAYDSTISASLRNEISSNIETKPVVITVKNGGYTAPDF